MNINDQAREELLEQVSSLTDEELNQQPAADRWSVKQLLEHLYLMEGAVASLITEKLASEEQGLADDKPIELTVNRSTKVDAPDFAVPSDQFATLKELKEQLAHTHSALRKLYEQTPADQLEVRTYPHPVFGEMKLSQWIPFVGYHERRHIEQIKEVRQQLNI